MVDTLAKPGSLAISKPADARRQTLEMDLVTRKTNPPVENFIFGKQFEYDLVRDFDITRVSRQCDPPERPAPFGKHGADIRWNEAGEVVGVLHAAFISHRPDVVAVIEGDCTPLLHIEHRLDVNGDGLDRLRCIDLRGARTKLRCLVQ